jgi:hypothetical protein
MSLAKRTIKLYLYVMLPHQACDDPSQLALIILYFSSLLHHTLYWLCALGCSLQIQLEVRFSAPKMHAFDAGHKTLFSILDKRCR